MGIFDDVLQGDQTLFKNEESLNFDFVPEILPFRENQQQHLARCIKPLFQGGNGRNLLIHGDPGIGKTAATKHVLRELEEKTDDINVCYVNCWQSNTTHRVLLDIADSLGYAFTQNKTTSVLMSTLTDIINKKAAVIVLDEVDKLEETDVLYLLAENLLRKSIFLITNYKSWIIELDQRIRSRLIPELLEFKRYSVPESAEILKQRVNVAFYPGVWTDDAQKAIDAKIPFIKDIRTGIFLLRESGLQAQDASSKMVTRDHVDLAANKLENFHIRSSLDLEKDTKFVLSIVKENPKSKIGDLFRIYQREGGVCAYKTFQRRMYKLEQGKFVKLVKSATRGQTTIVELVK